MDENLKQELVERLADVAMVEIDSLTKQLEDARAKLALYHDAEMAWERAMMAAIGEDGVGSVVAAISSLKAERDRLREALIDFKDLVSHHVEWTARGKEAKTIADRLERIEAALGTEPARDDGKLEV